MQDLTTYDAFIFDLDGTLVNSEKYHIRAFARAMKELTGYDLTARDEADFTGNTSLWLAGKLIREHGLDAVAEDVAARKFECLYREFRTEVFPGVRSFVRQWADVVQVGLASNSPRHFVSRVLSDAGLDDCVDVVVTVDDVVRRKPDPEMILLCLERLGVSAGRALVFEDSAVGIQAAVAAGCPSVLVDNGLFPVPADMPAGVWVSTWQTLGNHPVRATL